MVKVRVDKLFKQGTLIVGLNSVSYSKDPVASLISVPLISKTILTDFN